MKLLTFSLLNLVKKLDVLYCKTKNGKKFNARPLGSFEDRKVWYENGKSYIGKMLTVRYQELTNDKIPRFPVGVCIRDYE